VGNRDIQPLAPGGGFPSINGHPAAPPGYAPQFQDPQAAVRRDAGPPAKQQQAPPPDLTDALMDEIESIKHQFGSLEQHLLAEMKARKNAEKSFILPQLEYLNETVEKLQAELAESKQMNRSLLQMVTEKAAEKPAEKPAGPPAVDRSEFDLLKADVRSLSSKVKDLGGAAGDKGPGGAAPSNRPPDDVKRLEGKINDALADMKHQQVEATESIMTFFNGKMYQDLLKRLENTEKKCSIEVSTLRMNQEVENNSTQLSLSEIKAESEAEFRLLHSNASGLLAEFQSLKAVARSEIDEVISRLDCVEKNWDSSIGDGLRSLHADLSKGLAAAQAQHEELKCVVSAEITARRKTDKKQLAALQALADRCDRDRATSQQDLVNMSNQCNGRLVSVENSISMVASSFASQLGNLQESTSMAIKLLKDEIQTRGLSSKTTVEKDREMIKRALEENIALSRRLAELEGFHNNHATKAAAELSDFMQNVAIKFEDLEESIRKEGLARDAESKKLHSAVSTAMISESQKVDQATNNTLNKIRQATISILEVMDRKLDALEERTKEAVVLGIRGHEVSPLHAGPTPAAREQEPPPPSVTSSLHTHFVSLDSASAAPATGSAKQAQEDDGYITLESAGGSPRSLRGPRRSASPDFVSRIAQASAVQQSDDGGLDYTLEGSIYDQARQEAKEAAAARKAASSSSPPAGSPAPATAAAGPALTGKDSSSSLPSVSALHPSASLSSSAAVAAVESVVPAGQPEEPSPSPAASVPVINSPVDVPLEGSKPAGSGPGESRPPMQQPAGSPHTASVVAETSPVASQQALPASEEPLSPDRTAAKEAAGAVAPEEHEGVGGGHSAGAGSEPIEVHSTEEGEGNGAANSREEPQGPAAATSAAPSIQESTSVQSIESVPNEKSPLGGSSHTEKSLGDAHQPKEESKDQPLHASDSAHSVQSAPPSDRGASPSPKAETAAGLAPSASVTSVYSNQWSDGGDAPKEALAASGSADGIDKNAVYSVPVSAAPSTVASEADLHVLRNNSSNASIS
jgi:hypothetical protein